MDSRKWGNIIYGVIAIALVPAISPVLSAPPLSAEAQGDLQLQGLDQGKWKGLGALGKEKNENIVQVQTLSGPGGNLELVYAMPDIKAVKKIHKVAAIDGGDPVETELSSIFLGNAPVTGDTGEPVLPVVPCYIVLPAGVTHEDVAVTTGKKVKLPGTYKIRHAQPAVPLLKGAKAKYVPPKPEIYGSDDPWPASRLGTIRLQKKRGVSILIVNLNPVVYRPKSGSVSYFTSLKLTIHTVPEVPAPGGSRKIKCRPDKARPLGKQVDNPEALATYGAPTTKGGAK